MQRAAKRLRLATWSSVPEGTPCRYSSSTSEASTSAKPASIPRPRPPPLPRPFGVQHKARQVPESKEDKLQARESKNLATRKMLMGELKKSYFQDFAEVKSTGGKLWTAPDTVIQAKRSLFFPDLQGMCLADKSTKETAQLLRGKVTLLAVLSSRLSVEHVNSFATQLPAAVSSDPLFQLVQINLQENPLKSFLISMFLSTLRKEVPPAQHANYLLVSQNLELLHQPLGMSNKHIGYLYLVDQEARIRWAACGFAEPDELHGLADCAAVLLTRLKTGVKE